MDRSSFSAIEGLSEIGLRGGADMRPTLLRVLTDLYVHKLTHTADEERHYTELALRLLVSVDVATRSAIAARLARHLTAPRAVIARLTADVPEVAAALRQHLSPRPGAAAAAPERTAPTSSATGTPMVEAAPTPSAITADAAGELNELFFAADAGERRLILCSLHIVTAAPTDCTGLATDPAVGRRLEAAALARRREEFARELAGSLRISRRQARRVAADELGEPIIVAAKALSIPRDLLCRILLFVNTAIGHSVERVHALASLYDEITVAAAQDLVAVWQTINKNECAAAIRRPPQADSQLGARPLAAPRRPPILQHNQLRRQVS